MAPQFENRADIRELDEAELGIVSGGSGKDAKGRPVVTKEPPEPPPPPPYFGPGTIITIRF